MKKFKTFRNQIYESILETIGNTPLIRIPILPLHRSLCGQGAREINGIRQFIQKR